MNRRIIKIILSATSAIAAVQSAQALAQDGGPGDIVVTARRVEERLQDVPISVTVFNQEQLSKQNITNTTDLALYTPSLGSTNVLGNSQTTFSLRGFNQELTTSATVGVFFADVVAPRGATNQQPIGDGAGPGAFFDLQNVQVLKGPQGTLFGRNTTGGAILLVPQKPTGKFEGYVEGSYGNYDMYRMQGVLNVPISETIRARFGVDHQNRDGYVRNSSPVGPRRFNDVNYISARGSLVIDITPDIENYTIGTYARSDTVGEINSIVRATPQSRSVALPGGGSLTIPAAINTPFAFLAQQLLANQQAAGFGFYTVANPLQDPKTLLNQWQAINTTTLRASDTLTIKNIVSYAELRYKLRGAVYGNGYDLSTYNPFGQAFLNVAVNGNPRFANPGVTARRPLVFFPFAQGTYAPFVGADPRFLGRTASQSTFTEELQLQGSALENKLTWQGGVYYEDSQPLGESGQIASSGLAICDTGGLNCSRAFPTSGNVNLTAARKKIRSIGVYGQASYDLTDQLKLTGGLRYTWDRQTTRGRLITAVIPFPNTSALDVSPVNVGFTGANPAFCTIPSATVANACIETVSQRSQAPTWLLGVDYKPTGNVLAYAKYSRGYRTGGVVFQLPDPIRTYKEEKVDTYEVGAKLSFTGGLRGYFNIAAFYNDFTNQQIPLAVIDNPNDSITVPPATGVTNGGKSRIYGTEVETSVEVFRGLVAGASYSYLNATIRKIDVPTLTSGIYLTNPSIGIRVGEPLPFTAKHKLSLSLNYTLPLDESIGRITFGGTYTYTSSQVSTYLLRNPDGSLDSLAKLQPRNLVDLNATWRGIGGSPVDLTLFANNVTKDKYYTYVLELSGLNAPSAQLGLPRMYGARLRYSF